jgi:putative hydrolase of the HAD superfamily
MKAVLFDLGGTLIKTAPPNEIFGRILAAHGIWKPLESIELAIKEANKKVAVEDYRLPYRDFWKLYNMRILRLLKIKEGIEDLADSITNEWWDNADLTLYPDVKEVIVKVREMGLKTGIVTNGYLIDVIEVLSRTSLTGQFNILVGADTVGEPKPKKAIFLYAVERLGVASQDVLFVGDNLEIDYKGAEKAGLRPLLIDRENKIRMHIRKVQNLREIINYL